MLVVKRGKHLCMTNIFKNAIMSYHVMVLYCYIILMEMEDDLQT